MIRHERVTAAFSRPVSVQKFLAVAGSIVVLVGALSAFLRWAHSTVNSYPTKAEVDSAYVTKVDFRTYQQGEATVRFKDSLITDAHWARSDSALALLVRACRRRGDCT